MKQLKLKRFVVLGLTTLTINSCGIFGGSDGGSGGGAPKPDDKSATTPTPSANPVPSEPAIPLAVLSLDELINTIGAANFKPSELTEIQLAGRIKEVDNLDSNYSQSVDHTPYAIKNVFLVQNNEKISCSTKHSNSPIQTIAEASLDYVVWKLKEGLKEGTVEESDNKSTIKKIPATSSFATSSFSEERIRSDDDRSKNDTQYFTGATEDQIVQGFIKKIYTKDRLDTLINCARIYTKSTHELKSSCSYSMRAIGYAVQNNVTWTETYLPNQFTYTAKEAFFPLSNPTDNKETVQEYKQLTADTVSFNEESRSPNSESHMAGVYKFEHKNPGDFDSCAVISK